MNEYIVLYVTVPSPDIAESISKTLVSEHLVACVNIVGPIRSIYQWKGSVCDDSELLLIAKSRRPLFERIRERVTALHPYEVPEIVALPLVAGHEPYLRWIDESTLIEEQA